MKMFNKKTLLKILYLIIGYDLAIVLVDKSNEVVNLWHIAALFITLVAIIINEIDSDE